MPTGSRGQASETRLSYWLPLGRDPVSWERLHFENRVPGRWPYGLDALADATLTVSARQLRTYPWHPRRGAVDETHRDDKQRRAFTQAVDLTWEEYSALRLALTRRRNGALRASGVIWINDLSSNGGGNLKARLLRQALRSFDALWCLSAPQVDALRELLGRNHPPISYVRFGIDEDFFRAAPPPTRELRILSVGGDTGRDTATLYEALRIVKAKMPEVAMTVQTSNTTLPPPQGVDVVARFSHAALRAEYVRSSLVMIATVPNVHVSGMTVALEAMATARPVVITATPGMADYVQDGVTGLCANVGDAATLAEKAMELLRDDARRVTMGEAGRAAVEKRHTSVAMASEIRMVLHEMLSRSRSRRPSQRAN